MTDMHDTADLVSKALRRAWQLGQTYWQQADSECQSHWKKADTTQATFDQLVKDTRAVILADNSSAQPATSIKDAIIDDLQSQFDSEGITDHDSGDALIRLSDAMAAVEDNFVQPAPNFADAYQGAMEEVAIWKKRALEAEDLNRKFIAEINGPMLIGEPVADPAPSVPEGWKEVAIAWEVCASIHREYGKGKDPFFSTRQGDFVKHANDARAMLAGAPEAKP